MEQSGVPDRMKSMRLPKVASLIHVVRGRQVLLASDIAGLYGVETFNLNKAVRRNLERFPDEFMFRLTPDEYRALRFQIGMLKRGAHSKYRPLVFTQEGVAMLSSVLRSKRAVRVNIEIMRAFVRLRQALRANEELARKLEQVERVIAEHGAALGEHEAALRTVFDDLRALMGPPDGPRRKIGFRET